jgi:hypothetical protein
MLLWAVIVGVLLACVTSGFGWRVLVAAVPPVALFLPLVDAAVGDGTWRILLADPGVGLASEPTPMWRALLGWPSAPPVPAGLPVVGGVVLALSALVVLVALAALPRRGPRARAVRAGWALTLMGLACVWLAGRIDVSLAGQEIVRPWSGGAVSVILAGLLIAATCGADGSGAWIGLVGGTRRAEAALLAAVMLTGPGLQLTDTVWAWRSGRDIAVSRSSIPELPVIASTAAASPDRTSTLILTSEEDTLTWRLVRGRGLQEDDPAAVIATSRLTGPLMAAEVAPLPEGLEAISHLVARVAAGSAEGVTGEFAQAGIGFLLVPPGNKSLDAALDSTAGLSRAAETDSGVCWRVGGATDAGRPSWLRVIEPDGTQSALPATGGAVAGGAQGRTLLLAEAADPGWRATQAGKALNSIDIGWQQAFALEPGGGAIEISYRDSPLVAGQIGVLVVMALVALPLRRRRSEAGEG